jgi:PadR family transcriptional regulator, regulatory protein PadR
VVDFGYAPVAQMDRACASGAQGREFEPPQARHFKRPHLIYDASLGSTLPLLGNFELMVLLALLRLQEDAYGVPIVREIEGRTGREVAVGSVYAALERLEEKGLVSSRLGDSTPERGGRAKKYFRITALGLREVRATRRSLERLWHRLPQLEEA